MAPEPPPAAAATGVAGGKAALRTQLADQRTQIDELLKEAEDYRSQLSPNLLETHAELYKQRVLQRRNWWQRLVARLSAGK